MGQKCSKHNGHHIKQFAVGDNVSVRIPRIDRANTDLQRLPCIVVEIVGTSINGFTDEEDFTIHYATVLPHLTANDITVGMASMGDADQEVEDGPEG
ncbi:hypothetical protein EMCRGX_G001345 [Ephydatia muelleri]